MRFDERIDAMIREYEEKIKALRLTQQLLGVEGKATATGRINGKLAHVLRAEAAHSGNGNGHQATDLSAAIVALVGTEPRLSRWKLKNGLKKQGHTDTKARNRAIQALVAAGTVAQTGPANMRFYRLSHGSSNGHAAPPPGAKTKKKKMPTTPKYLLQRQQSADFLDKFDMKEPHDVPRHPGSRGTGALVRRGYLKKVSDGYIRTTKPYDLTAPR